MRHHPRFRPFAPLPPVYPFHDRRRRDRFLELVRGHLGRGGKKVTIEGGVARVLEILKTEVDRNMALGGWDRLADLDRSVLFASRR